MTHHLNWPIERYFSYLFIYLIICLLVCLNFWPDALSQTSPKTFTQSPFYPKEKHIQMQAMMVNKWKPIMWAFFIWRIKTFIWVCVEARNKKPHFYLSIFLLTFISFPYPQIALLIPLYVSHWHHATRTPYTLMSSSWRSESRGSPGSLQWPLTSGCPLPDTDQTEGGYEEL